MAAVALFESQVSSDCYATVNKVLAHARRFFRHSSLDVKIEIEIADVAVVNPSYLDASSVNLM